MHVAGSSTVASLYCSLFSDQKHIKSNTMPTDNQYIKQSFCWNVELRIVYVVRISFMPDLRFAIRCMMWYTKLYIIKITFKKCSTYKQGAFWYMRTFLCFVVKAFYYAPWTCLRSNASSATSCLGHFSPAKVSGKSLLKQAMTTFANGKQWRQRRGLQYK